MAIDARVVGVTLDMNGPGGSLILDDRPKTRKGDTGGCKGQSRLSFDACPEWVTDLIGKDIWGGSESIMYGEQEIATRKGYTRIVFTAVQLHGLGPKESKAKGKTPDL